MRRIHIMSAALVTRQLFNPLHNCQEMQQASAASLPKGAGITTSAAESERPGNAVSIVRFCRIASKW